MLYNNLQETAHFLTQLWIFVLLFHFISNLHSGEQSSFILKIKKCPWLVTNTMELSIEKLQHEQWPDPNYWITCYFNYLFTSTTFPLDYYK